MKIHLALAGLLTIVAQILSAQTTNNAAVHEYDLKGKSKTPLPSYDRSITLDTKSDTTANVSFGDFNGDGNLDLLLVKGRHWPIIDKILPGDGAGGFKQAYDLGKVADRSYTGGLADFNGDGFIDIAVSNDAPDRKLIYFNDGKGNFEVGSEFGVPRWPTRNLTVADINADGLPDLILANRGGKSTSNYICLNKGKGQFNADCIPFAPYPATTISLADFNKDRFIDLVVPHRDGGQSYIYMGGAGYGYSDTRRIAFGPADAMIRMSAVADFNEDSIPDIIVIDERKGVSLFYGQQGGTFSTGVSLADPAIVPYALTIADINNDNKMDIIVGFVESPSTVFVNGGKGRDFTSVSFGDSLGTVYGLAVRDFNKDGIPDIAAGRSDAPSVLYFGSIASEKQK